MNALPSTSPTLDGLRPPAVRGCCCLPRPRAALLAAPCRADGLEGRFEVRSADLELKDGVYHLNARIDLPVGDAVQHGLAEGVPLALEVDLDIERVRQLLPNSRVAD